MEKITMIWGTEAVKGIEKPEEGYTKKTYTFDTEAEKEACLLGVAECDGWYEYATVDELEYWGS